jgi:hypothetical protein
MFKLGIDSKAGDDALAARAFDDPSLKRHRERLGESVAKVNPNVELNVAAGTLLTARPPTALVPSSGGNIPVSYELGDCLVQIVALRSLKIAPFSAGINAGENSSANRNDEVVVA